MISSHVQEYQMKRGNDSERTKLKVMYSVTEFG